MIRQETFHYDRLKLNGINLKYILRFFKSMNYRINMEYRLSIYLLLLICYLIIFQIVLHIATKKHSQWIFNNNIK